MDTPADSSAKFVTVARILRARGNKGEVAALLLTDFPERLKTLGEVFLAADSGVPRKVALQSLWVDRNHPGQCVLRFADVSSIDDAEKLPAANFVDPWIARVDYVPIDGLGWIAMAGNKCSCGAHSGS